MRTKFQMKSLKREDHLGPNVDGRTILKLILKKYGVYNTHLAQTRDERKAVVNTVMNSGFEKKRT